MATEIKRATALVVIEAVNSSANSEVDTSDPRSRSNGLGEISPVSFKRKIRDIVGDHEGIFFQSLPAKFRDHPDRYNLLEAPDIDKKLVISQLSKDPAHYDNDAFLKSQFVHYYWDGRVFGNTFLNEGLHRGFIKTGVIQIGMGLSICPIEIDRLTYTSVAPKGTPKDGDKESGKMAPLGYRVVQHAVYCLPIFVNPNYAHKTGCTADDVELFKLTMPYAYDLTRSAVRPDVRIRHAWYIEHKSPLGSWPDYQLIDALTPTRKGNVNEPSASWNDYIDKTGLPEHLLSRVESCVDLALQ